VTPAPLVYVAGDGTGDFNCDGDNDQIEINQALTYVDENPEYTTIYLKGPFTYIIDDTLLIGSGTTLEGDSTATIKLIDDAGWASEKPLIKEKNSSSTDVIIRGFTIDGNREENTNVRSGRGYYNLIHLSNCQNISVYNMYLTNNHGDGLKTDNCSNIKFYNNKIYSLGHDALYPSSCSYIEAYNNTISCRTNSGLRLYNSNHAAFHDNIIYSEEGGGAGIEIQKDGDPVMDDINVYNNTIYDTALSGILIFGSGEYSNSSANIHVHHNQIYDTGTDLGSDLVGGILSEGFNGLIENNVIDGAYGAGIVLKSAYYSSPDASGFVITVKNNIITNTRESESGENGSAICNLLTDTHSFILQNNSFYSNLGGNYIGVEASPWDILADPQYVDRDNHDYHLRSKAGRWDGNSWVKDNLSSPCIDAGDPLSDYSCEPEPNGNRINIGPDGNTWYASKSEFEIFIEKDENSSKKNSHSSGGGGGSGGTGGSPEPSKNVKIKELSQVFITSGNPVKFEFPRNATDIVHLCFDPKKTVGKTTTVVEMLKNKSTLTKETPENEIYNYLNIWVGNGGYGSDEDNLENASICFKVEKAWVEDKNIDHSSITLNRYSDKKWNELPTFLLSGDDKHLYFKAETPGFSPFAITGKIIEKENVIEIMPESSPQDSEQNTSTESEVENITQKSGKIESQQDDASTPGFEIAMGMVCLAGVFLHKRKEK
jgi:PGF-pre-PGF domain-containing protein